MFCKFRQRLETLGKAATPIQLAILISSYINRNLKGILTFQVLKSKSAGVFEYTCKCDIEGKSKDNEIL
jgi:hypothetical protein